ncbi:MAG TPA: hypothetical protein PLE04_03810 [Syntrophales bacterium]|nr:hypothetical protein [Syntrophales bacterium]
MHRISTTATVSSSIEVFTAPGTASFHRCLQVCDGPAGNRSVSAEAAGCMEKPRRNLP